METHDVRPAPHQVTNSAEDSVKEPGWEKREKQKSDTKAGERYEMNKTKNRKKY